MTDHKERHWDYVDRIYAIPEGPERDAIIAEELREFAAGLRDGTIEAVGSPGWSEGGGGTSVPGMLSLYFIRHPEIYDGGVASGEPSE